MRRDSDFAPRFRLALQAMRMSRGTAAARLQVDKSLVGRWAAGTVCPSDHNLARITRLVSEHVPAFTGLDWDRDLSDFAALLGLDAEIALKTLAPAPDQPSLPLKCLEMAREETDRRGATYEGFWRTSRPSLLMRDKVFHDYGLIRRSASGLLEVTMAGAGLGYSGWAFPLEGNLFAVLDQSAGFTPMFLIFRGVPLPKATLLEGIGLMAAMDAGRTPAAFPLFLERLGDLSGNPEADEERCRQWTASRPHNDPGEVPEPIRSHLFRNPEPGVDAADPVFLLAASLMSRGATQSGDLEG